MRCEICQGSGLSISPNLVVPCGECGGFGMIYSCEGLISDPQFEPRRAVAALNTTSMFDCAAQSDQSSDNQIRISRDDERESEGWKLLTTDFPFREGFISLVTSPHKQRSQSVPLNGL